MWIPEGAADAVVKIYKDNSLKEKLITNALNKVEMNYSIERVVKQHIYLFEQLTCQTATGGVKPYVSITYIYATRFHYPHSEYRKVA